MTATPTAHDRGPPYLWACVVAFIALSGCAHVAPYERERLAHPTMSTSDLAGPGEAHVRAVHEGAVGGGSVAESGCGCN